MRSVNLVQIIEAGKLSSSAEDQSERRVLIKHRRAENREEESLGSFTSPPLPPVVSSCVRPVCAENLYFKNQCNILRW